MHNQFFVFDAKQGIWYNEYTQQGIMLAHGEEVKSGANIVTAPRKNKKNITRMKWRMVPCADLKKGKEGKEDHHEEKEKEDHEETEKKEEDKEDEKEDDESDDEEHDE